MPKKPLLILSSSLIFGIFFVIFVETSISTSQNVFRTTDQEMLYQTSIKEGKLAYSAKENMFPIDDNVIYASCTTLLKSEEEVEGFVEGYYSFKN